MNRLAIITIGFLAICGLFSCEVENNVRPNVILILTDDQGSIDVNCYGADDLYTPGMDRLADEGLRFTRFYVGSAICSPSRASLLTGLTPQSAGVAGNVSSIPGNDGMPAEMVTIAELFQDAGYSTGHIGKWHLGYSKETMPMAQGFDYSFGHMGGCIDNYSHFFYWNGPNRHDLWENGQEVFEEGSFFPDLMAERAESFIRDNRKRPFFLYYAINIPHYPLQPGEKWREYYKEMDMPRRDYAGFVSTADENIGRLTDLLDQLGIRRNTIIIFLSDHGQSYEERAFGGGGNSGPFRGGKSSLFEGGIRVPAIISWPGHLPEGETRSQVIHSIDLLPTIISMCGIDSSLPATEGLDLYENIRSDSRLPLRNLFWKMGSQWAVRSGEWKLIGYPQDPSGKYPLNRDNDILWLSNLIQDSTETVNLAKQYPEVVERLKGEYLGWIHAAEDDIPSVPEPFANIAEGASVTLANPPSSKYFANGTSSLTDNSAGSRIHNDGYWLGFESDNLDATIDLGKEMKLTSVTTRFLINQEAWIFNPLSVEIEFSDNGSIFRDKKTIECPAVAVSGVRISEYSVEANTRARYIRVLATNTGVNPDWHSNPGGRSWLFTDEIIVK